MKKIFILLLLFKNFLLTKYYISRIICQKRRSMPNLFNMQISLINELFYFMFQPMLNLFQSIVVLEKGLWCLQNYYIVFNFSSMLTFWICPVIGSEFFTLQKYFDDWNTPRSDIDIVNFVVLILHMLIFISHFLNFSPLSSIIERSANSLIHFLLGPHHTFNAPKQWSPQFC